MKKVLSFVLIVATLLSVIGVVAIVGSADNGAVEIQFRGFESAKADYAANFGNPFVAINNATYNTPAVGNGYVGAKATADATEMHHFIYAYNQNNGDAADGTNADGVTKMLVTDPTKLYVSFDLYVSDASVFSKPAGDCGFGIDTLEFGTKENWGSTFRVSAKQVKAVFATLKDGWNHVLLPLSLASSSVKDSMTNQTVTFCTMRLYAVGVAISDGFVSAVDDVRIMNQQAAFSTYLERTIAKTVTDGIRAYPASATYEDFYKIYAAYNATPEKYRSLVIGWDAFMTQNASFKAQGDTALATDQPAAKNVSEIIAALPFVLSEDTFEAELPKIEAARKAYDALTETQKAMVYNYALLEDLESQVVTIETRFNQNKANEVRNIIAALPKADKITVADKAAVEAARAAFSALTPAQQELVINTAILEKAEKALEEAMELEGVIAVEELINALPETVTADDKAAVEAARAAFAALTQRQQAMVTNLAKLEAAEEALKDTDTPVDPNPPVPGEYKVGDLNGDDAVNAKDALLVLQYTVKKIDKFPIEE